MIYKIKRIYKIIFNFLIIDVWCLWIWWCLWIQLKGKTIILCRYVCFALKRTIGKWWAPECQLSHLQATGEGTRPLPSRKVATIGSSIIGSTITPLVELRTTPTPRGQHLLRRKLSWTTLGDYFYTQFATAQPLNFYYDKHVDYKTFNLKKRRTMNFSLFIVSYLRIFYCLCRNISSLLQLCQSLVSDVAITLKLINYIDLQLN